jgi:hypothetical protein
MFGILTKKPKNNTNETVEIEDIETKYNMMLSEVRMLNTDALNILKKEAYYLALNTMAHKQGVKESEVWIDYHMGRVSALTIVLNRLYRITGGNPINIDEIIAKEKQKAIDDLNRCENIMELLKVDEKKENKG